MAANEPGRTSREYFEVRILRQAGPGQASYWERHRVAYERDMNVISALQKIAAIARNAEGKPVAPVTWECNCLEEVCGACTMVINGRVRQACTALVDRLLEDRPEGIELRPMSKFPVVRDLIVDRLALDAIMRAGGFISANAGAAPEANSIPVPRAHASPAVRRFARELGVDLGVVKGSGPKGRVLKEDVPGFVKRALADSLGQELVAVVLAGAGDLDDLELAAAEIDKAFGIVQR